MFHVKHFGKVLSAGSQPPLVGSSRSKAGRCLDGLVKPPESLPLDSDELRLFRQKSIGDGRIECLAHGFFMCRVRDQNDGDRSARRGFGVGTAALNNAFKGNAALGHARRNRRCRTRPVVN
jgi:hypothetical protein